MIIPLLGGLDLYQAVITADALHCQRATADYVHGRGADFAFPVKDNQPGLFGALDALPWHKLPVTHATLTAATAGSKPVPSRSSTRPAICRSRTSARPT